MNQYPHTTKRGPEGRLLCRVCGQEVPRGRRTFCGDDCVDRYMSEISWPYVVAKVQKRDHGICAACGLDCAKLERILRAVRRYPDVGPSAWRADAISTWHAAMRVLGLRTTGSIWEVHHRVERKRGGTNDLDNLVTLCQQCHAAETKRFATERARERREAKRHPLLEQA